MLHCFWAELFYAHWIRGDIVTPDQMKKQSESLAPDQADQVFAFGYSARKAMREATSTMADEDWEKPHDAEMRGFRLEGPARKLIAQILVHEIRH